MGRDSYLSSEPEKSDCASEFATEVVHGTQATSSGGLMIRKLHAAGASSLAQCPWMMDKRSQSTR